jgi:hypothetical protein
MKLTFTSFGLAALERHARREAITAPVIVSRAASYLAADLGSGRPELQALSVEHSDSSRSVDLELQLAADASRALELEAKRQSITFEELLEFATVYYIAEMESGLAAERILRRAEEDA